MRTRKLFDSTRLLLSRPTPKRVVRVQFAVTWRCQLKCSMCNIWQKPKTREITTDEIRRIFDGHEFLDSLRIVDITGGEPFLREDLPEIVEYFANCFSKADILITTNAYSTGLTEKLGKRILDTIPADRIEFSISIDGNERTHDAIRGRQGSFKNALESTQILKKLGAKKITISTTITPQNAEQLPFIYELAQKIGATFATARFAQNSFYYGNERTTNGNAWTSEKLKVAEVSIQKLLQMRRSREGKSLGLLRDAYFMKEAVRFQKNPVRTRPCYSGTHSFFIDPEANVYPCVMLPKRIGNALESGLDELWFSERADEIRRFIAAGHCACHTECETFSSMQRNMRDVVKILLGVFVS